MLDIFFEALNYETIEQKKAYEVAGLLGERSGPLAVPCDGWMPHVGILQRGPACCEPSPEAPGCADSVGAEQGTPPGHSGDGFCPFFDPSAPRRRARAPLMNSLSSPFLSLPGDIGGQMGLFIGASILTVLELFDYAYEVSTSAIPWLRGGPGYAGTPKCSPPVPSDPPELAQPHPPLGTTFPRGWQSLLGGAGPFPAPWAHGRAICEPAWS